MFMQVRGRFTALTVISALVISGGPALAQEGDLHSPATPEDTKVSEAPAPAQEGAAVSSPESSTRVDSSSPSDLPLAPSENISPEESPRGKGVHRLDVGVSSGFNNPGGIYGVEADFRLIDRISVGLAAGSGAWGMRITPQARLYPFGISSAGLFLESGLSLNLGGKATATSNGEVIQEADMAFAPVVNLSLGYRVGIRQWGWWAIRFGYGFRLNDSSYTLRDSTALDPLLETVLSASKPGGFLLGVSGGFSAL
jgi:hypothetical protein